MNVLNTMGNIVALVKDWYDNLTESEKDTTAVYMVVGDMKNKMNVDFIAGGSSKDVVLALAQTMANDKDFHAVAKAAVSLVDSYNEELLKECEEMNGGTGAKKLS